MFDSDDEDALDECARLRQLAQDTKACAAVTLRHAGLLLHAALFTDRGMFVLADLLQTATYLRSGCPAAAET